MTVNNTEDPNAYDFYNSSFATGVTDGTNFISTASQAGAGIDAPEFIASGQGFMANVTGNGTVNFNNSMRVAGNNDTFLRISRFTI